MIRAVILVLLALGACGNGPAPVDPVPLDVESLALPFDSSDAARQGGGRLKYLGGLALRARPAWFGGFSSLRCTRQCLAVSDEGTMLRFDLVEDGDRLVGIANVSAAALLGNDGNPRDKATGDAESLVLSPGGAEALVGFEGTNSFAVFPTGGTRLSVEREYRLPEMADWPRNGGPETLVMLAGGKPLVIAEKAQSGAMVPALVIGGHVNPDGSRRNVAFSYVPPDTFAPTDAALLDDAHLLVLNRAFSALGGVAMALVEIDVAEIADGAVISGREIARLRPPASIDNMEGIDVRRDGDRTFLYLLSDDNFNAAQRTLLLKLELLPDSKKPAE